MRGVEYTKENKFNIGINKENTKGGLTGSKIIKLYGNTKEEIWLILGK